MPVYYNRIHELDYCLMCSVELGHIGADSARYVERYMPNVSEWYDWREERNQNLGNYKSICKDFARDVENKYTRWARTNDEPREHANCTYDYLIHANKMFEELMQASAESTISEFDSIVESSEILDRVENDIGNFVSKNKHIKNLLTRHRKFVLRNRNVDTGLLRESAWAIQREYLDAQAWQRKQYDMLINGDTPAKQAKKESKLAKAYRKVAKKSVQVLSNMTDSETTSAFINGDHVDIEGELFTYRLTKTSLLTQPTFSFHGLISIQVLDQKTNDHLFNLCWYLDDTPPAEQLLGFMLHVRSGNEKGILRAGNTFNINRNLTPDVANDAKMKLSRVYKNTQKVINFERSSGSENNTRLGQLTDSSSYLMFYHGRDIDEYNDVKSRLKSSFKKHVLENHPEFDNFAYQRNITFDRQNDQTVSTITNDFKFLIGE